MRPTHFQVAIIVILGGVYAFTIAPDLTWAHHSADSGDLISAAFTGGVPHPTGYPLYLILARIFLWLPLGSPAFRTNLLSAVCTVLTVFLLYEYLLRQLKDGPFKQWIAWLSAVSYGFAPFVWGQALVTEVYALHAFLLISCLLVLDLPAGSRGDGVKGFIFGLAATNHLTSVMMFPLLILGDAGRFNLTFSRFCHRILGVICGLALYVLLPVRASFDPPINWGHASNWEGFIWLVSGRLYHSYLFSLAFTDVVLRIQAFAGLLIEQYTWLGVLLGFFGLLAAIPRRVLLPTAWMSFCFLAYAVNYGSFDSHVYLLPVWLAFAVWLAFGFQALLSMFAQRWLQIAAGMALLLLIMLRVPAIYNSVDVSDEVVAKEFLNKAGRELPRNALVFVEGDGHIFSLWYLQHALGKRNDLVVIATGLLPFEWYLEDLALLETYGATPQDLPVTPFDIIVATPWRTVCFIGYDGLIDCP